VTQPSPRRCSVRGCAFRVRLRARVAQSLSIATRYSGLPQSMLSITPFCIDFQRRPEAAFVRFLSARSKLGRKFFRRPTPAGSTSVRFDRRSSPDELVGDGTPRNHVGQSIHEPDHAQAELPGPLLRLRLLHIRSPRSRKHRPSIKNHPPVKRRPRTTTSSPPSSPIRRTRR
jgi:hypothetical protein